MEIRLSDGTEVVVRRIRADDKPLLADALGRLSDASVRSRFLAPKPRFTAHELRYLTSSTSATTTPSSRRRASGPA